MLNQACDICGKASQFCIFPEAYWEEQEKICSHPDADRAFFACSNKCEGKIADLLISGKRLSWMSVDRKDGKRAKR